MFQSFEQEERKFPLTKEKSVSKCWLFKLVDSMAHFPDKINKDDSVVVQRNSHGQGEEETRGGKIDLINFNLLNY